MNVPSDKPLRKVTLNLFEADVEWLERQGTGWTVIIRDVISNYVDRHKHGSLADKLRSIIHERQ